MSDSILLKVDSIGFSINQNRLFHNLSFNLQKGKALHIKGNNGSGKSSLIRILLGITPVSKGSILWNKNTDICFLGHKNVLKNYLTLSDNLYIHGIDSNESKTKDILADLGLIKRLDTIVGNLSYGQQKKLALIRIFLNQAKVIILDEPCVGLDDSTRILTTKFLSSELKKNKSIIYTSHIPIDIDSETITLGGNQV